MLLAEFYEDKGDYNTAMKLYDSVLFVSKVLEMHKNLISKSSDNLKMRLDYSEYAISHFRQELAVEILQEAF